MEGRSFAPKDGVVEVAVAEEEVVVGVPEANLKKN